MTYQEQPSAAQLQSDRPSPLLGHLDRHGGSLMAMVAALDDIFVTHAVEEALLLADGPTPDLDRIRVELEVVHEALEITSSEMLNARRSHYHGPDLAAALRWHGARLTDLLS